jgi:hypothetical protein
LFFRAIQNSTWPFWPEKSSWISNRFKKIHFVRTPKGTTFGKFGCWACSGSEEVGNVKDLQHTGGLSERQMAARHFVS